MNTAAHHWLRLVFCAALLCGSINAYAAQQVTLTSEDKKKLDEYWRSYIRVGDSSIYLLPDAYKRFMEEGELPSPLGVTLRGDISAKDIAIVRRLLAPYLNKNYFKTHPKPSWYKPDSYDEGYRIDLESDGGDMYAAMAVGRMFRKARVGAIVGALYGRCMSSCVLLLAGAVDRTIYGPVGIHRPYSTDTKSVSFEEMQAITEKLGSDVASYLREMNIPGSLYEAMTRVPPESIKILDESELILFGLNDRDPVFAELNDNLEATLAHVTKGEFLARKAASQKCQFEGYKRLRQANDGEEPDQFALAQMSRECDQQTIYRDVLTK